MNAANELTGFGETHGASWIDSAYDAAGNMTRMARSGDEADANDGLLMVYDAWNRLAAVYDDNNGDGQIGAGDQLMANYLYDGVGRMVRAYSDGYEADREYHYDSSWRMLECYADMDLREAYIWDLRYVDAAAIRFRDNNLDGDFIDPQDDVQHYTHDANFNVTALVQVHPEGSIMERYTYDAYGKVTILNGDYGIDPGDISTNDWELDADQPGAMQRRKLSWHLLSQ